MKSCIEKERIHLMSPCANVCGVAVFSGEIGEDALHAAIEQAVHKNRILCCRVALEPEGSAFFEECTGAPAVELKAFAGETERLVLAQDAIPFRLETGESVRFYYRHAAEGTELVAVAHHVVCDGGSMMILLRDILLALNGRQIETKPVRLLRREDLPTHPGLNVFLRAMMRRTNERWRKSGRAFTFAQQAEMQRAYADAHSDALAVRRIGKEQLETLKRAAQTRDVTVNSVLAAACASILPAGEKIGVAVDIRPEEIKGMGNFATGVSAMATYDARRTLVENAGKMHAAIHGALDRPREKYFLYEFMGALAPTLIDAIYFTRYAGYRDTVAEAACKMCGYTDNPKGLSLSNLKTIEMPDDPYWEHRMRSVYFIPPYVPNVRGVLGVSSYGGEMTLTLRTESQTDWLDRIVAAIAAPDAVSPTA